MWLLLSVPAGAATWTVPTDFPTIAQAIASSATGDVIRLEPGVYAESVNVSGKALTFEGQPGVTWVPAGDEMLDCEAGAVCTVRDIVFDGLEQHQAIDVEVDASLIVERCRFVGGADLYGGGIHADGADSLVIRDSAFYRNSVVNDGGHVRASQTARVEIVNSTFVSGRAAVDGGAIRVTSSGEVVLSGLWLVGNEAGDDGGAIDIDATESVDMRRSFVCANVTGDEGGGVVVRDAQAELVGNIFVNNVAAEGGGLFQNAGTLRTRHTHFVANQATAGGAGSYSSTAHTSTNDLYAWNTGALAQQGSSIALAFALFWSNADGDTQVAPPDSVLFEDPLLAAVPPVGCAPALLVPLLGSPLLGAGDGGNDIGAFGGPDAYDLSLAPSDADADGLDSSVDCDDSDASVGPGLPEIGCNGVDNDCDALTPDIRDEDGDGATVCEDCDDTDVDIAPGQPELPADLRDQDCDGRELCHADEDGDGFGEPSLVTSDDLDCEDLGEALAEDDLCPGFDDNLDFDADGLPDGCDPDPGIDTEINPTEPGDTGAGGTDTGTTDTDEPAPDLSDNDGDGIPDVIDPSPEDAGGRVVDSPKADLGCGCSASAQGQLPAGLGLALLGLVLRRRRS